jgi:hypothetical protein
MPRGYPEKPQKAADPNRAALPLVGMSAFYVKNVPPVERWLRILVALAVVAYALVALGGLWRPLVAAGAGGFALTGLFGFCPACAMIGRKLDNAR